VIKKSIHGAARVIGSGAVRMVEQAKMNENATVFLHTQLRIF
jgi:hypothetical protein